MIRTVGGRFSDVGSSISCAKWLWLGLVTMSLFGDSEATMFRSSGMSRVLVSAVALHLVSKCTMSSAGAGYSGNKCWHRRQAGSSFRSVALYAKHGKSPDSIRRCTLALITS